MPCVSPSNSPPRPPLWAPFIEFAAGFYVLGTREWNVMAGAIHEVHTIAVGLSNPWDLGLWADAGWYGGRLLGNNDNALLAELFAGVRPQDLPHYVDLYHGCVVGTAGPDGAVRPARAVLKFFGLTVRDIYARAYCRNDQPRFVARAAFDFMFWMGLLSTQPLPRNLR